jgi:hypothetical protein
MGSPDNATVELTKEEVEILKHLIANAPLQGTVQTLPTALSLLASILNKLNEQSV